MRSVVDGSATGLSPRTDGVNAGHIHVRTCQAAGWDGAPVWAAVVDGVSAPGGRAGSVAIAQPPCSGATAGLISRGVGQIRLLGGATSPTFDCPLDSGLIGSHTANRTTWQVEGSAVGDSTLAQTTLFVVDLPQQLPSAAR